MKTIAPPCLLLQAIIIMLLSSLLMPSVCKGQASDNFNTIVVQKDHYYDSLIQVHGIQNMKGTGYSGYMRWKEEWSHIIGPSGSISEAQLRVLDFAQRFKNIKTTMPKVNANWTELGPIYLPENIGDHPMHAGIGRIHAVAFDPNNASHVFAMSATGGLYYSFDGGENWNNGGTDKMNIVGVASLVVDPQNSDRWYIGTGDCDGASARWCFSTTDGVWRTLNNGQQWNQILSNSIIKTPTRIRKLLMHPSDNNILFAVTDTAIYRTSNATATSPSWISVVQGHFNDLHFKPGNPAIMYASGYWGDQLYVSTNTGTSFTKITNTPLNSSSDIMIEFSAANPNLLYIAESVNSKIRIRLLDISQYPTLQWTLKGWVKYQYSGSNDTIYLLNLAKGFSVSPANPNIIHIGDCMNNPIVQSTDQGLTWTAMDGNYHVDIHHLIYSPSNELWVGTDGGISKLTNTGWINKTKNMGVANLHFISGAVTDSNYVLMGAYDVGSNMLNKIKAPEQRWKNFGLNDGTSCAIDPKTSSRFYVTGQSGTFFWRYENYGQTLPVQLTVPGSTDFFTWFKLSSLVDNTVFFVTLKNIYRSRNKGETWQPITTNIDVVDSVKFFYKLYTAPNDSNIMYVRDLGKHWKPERWLKTSNANANNPSAVIWSVFPTPKRGGDDMAIDSRNANVLWLVHNNWRGDTTVVKFDGTYWHDLTYNLKALQIWGLTSIVHDNLINPSGRTYVGGYKGVYYLDDGATQWTLMDGLPNVKIDQLEIDYNSGKLRAGTYGRGLWEAPIANAYCTEPVVITGDTTLAAEAISYCDLRVAPGAVFTITGKLHMSQGKRIIIDKGGKLVLDAGTITGYLHRTWQGIEVWGNSSLSQIPASNQGYLKTLNNALIEDAKTAVNTIKIENGSPNYTNTGGIVNCNKTTFRNCGACAVFHPYENHHPTNGGIINNVSAFGDCVFEVNSRYAGADSVKAFVSLTQVRGVQFAACKFTDDNTAGLTGKTIGIYAYNSAFKVSSTCNVVVPPNTPCTDINYSRFTGLEYGVKVLGAATTKTFDVDCALFYAKKCGLYASSIDYARLTRNSFFVSATDTCSNTTNCAYGGAYFDQCKFYTIEENTFSKTGAQGNPSQKMVGLTINNSGPDNNQVYKNTFDNLDIGILAQRQNKDPNDPTRGLCLRCNNFNSCKYDIAVTKPLNGSLNQNGIAKTQGSSTYPAGNLFTNTDFFTYPTYCNYFNIQGASLLSAYQITYYHHIQTQQYRTIPNIRKNVSLVITNLSYGLDTCASHLGGGVNPASKLAQSDNQATEKAEELNALIDGGATAETVSEVTYSCPDEALEIHDALLQKSPYLSDTVMKAAIEQENVLNNALVRDILVANPQSAKSEELLNAVDQRSDPLTDYMIDEILEGAGITSPKEQLEADVAMEHNNADGWYNCMVTGILNDTVGVNVEALTSLLDSRPRPANDYYKAYKDLEAGDTIGGLQRLQEIPEQYLYNEAQNDDHYVIVEKYRMLGKLLSGNKPVQLMDSLTAANFIQNIATDDQLGDTWLRNCLAASGKINFTEQYILPDLTKSVEVDIPVKKNKPTNDYLKVFPNPAREYIVIEYRAAKLSDSYILITDAMGKPVDKLVIKREADQITYITKYLVSGIYNCSLSIDGNNKSSIRFTVVR